MRCPTYADIVDKNPAKLPWRLVNDTASTKDSTKFAAELRVGGLKNFNRTTLRTQLGSTASLAAGATSIQEPRDEFYGDRTAAVKDTEGTSWYFATHQTTYSPEELQRRANEARKG